MLVNILVTGGSGFFGYWMKQTQPDNFFVCYQNKENYQTRWDLAHTTPWDYIVHLAPTSPERALRYAEKYDTKVLFTSSGAVYNGKTEYANNKRKWEQECLSSSANVVITRPFTFIGEHMRWWANNAITNFIKKYKEGLPVQVWGDGSSVRSYLYGKDLGEWLWKILFMGNKNTVYDIGSTIQYTILEVAKMISNKIEFIYPEHEEDIYLPITAKAKKLGCEETISLDESIRRCINE